MRQYATHHPLWMSFFSRALYRDVGRNWQGLGLSYLLLLLALVWVLTLAQFHFAVARFVEQEAPAFVRHVPKITISNGELSIDRPTPYFIIDPEKGEKFVVFALAGEYASPEEAGVRVLVTKNKVIVKHRKYETRTYDLSGVKQFTVGQADVERWLGIAKGWLAILVYPFALLFSFLYRFIQALLYAAIGILFAQGLKVSLDYAALVRLAVVAITPVVIADTALDLASVRVPGWWLLCFLGAMAYLWFAVKANREPEIAGTGAEYATLSGPPRRFS